MIFGVLFLKFLEDGGKMQKVQKNHMKKICKNPIWTFQKCPNPKSASTFVHFFVSTFFLVPFFQLHSLYIGNLYRHFISCYYIMSTNRRLLHEKNKDSWEFHGIEYFEDDNIIYIPIHDKFIDDVTLLVVKIKNCYPFRSPEVIFNGQDVISYYSKLTSILSTNIDFKKVTGKRCLCCCSVVCGNNWSVTNRIMDIKNEFQEIYNLRLRIAQRYWSKRIASRYLVEDIPLDDYL